MTELMETDRQPWWRFFGPWPLQPLPMAGIATLLSLALGIEDGPWLDQGANFLAGAGVAAATWLMFSVSARWAPNLVATAGGYLLVMVSAAVVITAMREAAGVIPGSLNPGIRLPGVIAVSTVMLLVLQGILGSAQARLRRENERASAALVNVRQQQEALLRADETIRQQVAVVLHDQVQAGLVSACLRLQTVRAESEGFEEHDEAISEVIRQLERLRALDLRRAVRSLSPNLRDVDMQTSLEELAETWAPNMNVEVVVRGSFPKDHDLRLGSYRIVEQGLLNAAAHGHARTCAVAIDVGVHIEIVIDDDGVGLPEVPEPGLGSTLLTTWCRTLHGSWHWEDSPRGGTRLRADVPLRQEGTP